MYKQGTPGDGLGGEQDGWSTRPPRIETTGTPRRRRRSAESAEPAQDAQTATPQEHRPAPAQRLSFDGDGYPAQPGYVRQPGYSEPGSYTRQYGYGEPGSYTQQYGYGEPGGYTGQYGYGEQGSYTQRSGYIDGYPRQNGYAEPGSYTQQSGYIDLGGYPQRNAYPQQGGYADVGGYPQQGGYADPNGYPQQGGYADPNGYPQQGGYADMGGYPQQGGYADLSDYSQQGGYSDPGDHPRQSGAAGEHRYDPNDYPATQANYSTSTYDPSRSGYAPVPPAEEGGSGFKEFLKKNGAQMAILLLVLGALAAWAAFGGNGRNPRPQPNGIHTPAVTGTQSGNTPVKGNVSAYAELFLPNVYVDGICLADMTYEQGVSAVWAQVNQKQNSWYVRLKNENGSSKDITAAMLGISFDPTLALQQAWAVGHPVAADGKVDQKALQQAVSLALTTEYHFASAQQSADTTPIDTILNTLQTNAYRAPQDAVILSFNPDDFVNPFTFQEEVWGQWLDVSAVKQEILALVNSMQTGEVLLQTTPIAPNVTVSDLQKTVTLRCRAVTPISSSSTEERTNNIRVALAKINGKSLAHGDKFSFNKMVGRRSLENGFFEAIEYAYGEEVMGVGGGVCQASTTVYLAAVQSGMTITSRDAHSNPVNYTSLGMDATVSDTRGREVDFAFKNESGGRVFIAAHVVESGSNGRSLLCEVRIYGPSLDNIHYKLESETVEILPKPEEPKLKEDKTGERVYYVDEMKQISKGREGYVVDTYLCTYQDDILIGRDKISTDTYPARQDVYWIGVHSR